VVAVVLGFSAAIAMWAFEFGKDIAGPRPRCQGGTRPTAREVTTLRDEREQAQSVANTADSLLKAEKAAQERLASN
jgi:hypothetical protein